MSLQNRGELHLLVDDPAVAYPQRLKAAADIRKMDKALFRAFRGWVLSAVCELWLNEYHGTTIHSSLLNQTMGSIFGDYVIKLEKHRVNRTLPSGGVAFFYDLLDEIRSKLSTRQALVGQQDLIQLFEGFIEGVESLEPGTRHRPTPRENNCIGLGSSTLSSMSASNFLPDKPMPFSSLTSICGISIYGTIPLASTSSRDPGQFHAAG
eukprot:CAMPEP_0175133400 /NCGR_PEP_ID=MMETSP0087-20121206/7620_1 /TAXON_ID=136419 /ORGANISM="Unknown Unknown, Strain D1" /LENGTH=207 /DNA_ID=CAMNT_0016415883 /DNA_START=306 /DNA_END=927 /DNA_ORIENTATION=+